MGRISARLKPGKKAAAEGSAGGLSSGTELLACGGSHPIHAAAAAPTSHLCFGAGRAIGGSLGEGSPLKGCHPPVMDKHASSRPGVAPSCRLLSFLPGVPPNLFSAGLGMPPPSIRVRWELGTPAANAESLWRSPQAPREGGGEEADSPQPSPGSKAVEQIEFRGSLLLPAAATEIPNAPYASFLQSFGFLFMSLCHSIICL